MSRIPTLIIAALALLILSNSGSYAQATRTWVSGVGDDANPCSRTAPCKTFAGAISKTAPKGEISVLDPGGFGTVTITKSISIVSEGSEGSISACGTNGINIAAAAADTVNIHGLFIEGCGTALNGIRITSAGEVHIRKVLIRGFNGVNGTGVAIQPGASPATKVTISDSTISTNQRGIFSSPTGTGFTKIFLDRVMIEKNAGGAIRADNHSTVFLSNSTITGNGNGLVSVGAGSFISFGNNALSNNTAGDGVLQGTLPLQ
jgi:hypothetical protein